MRKPSSFVIAGLAITVAGLFASSDPVFAQGMGMGPNLENMFLDADTDTFDPGLPIGAAFPAIRARFQGQEITNLDQFQGDRGIALFALRSADW